jgi:hypothetical protein
MRGPGPGFNTPWYFGRGSTPVQFDCAKWRIQE